MLRLKRKIESIIYGRLESVFRKVERGQFSRGEVLQYIPRYNRRGGGLGTTSYGEWCYTIGIFQTLIFQNLPARAIKILDVGCGVGRLYLAAKPYLSDADSYLGIDVTQSVIDVCRSQYKAKNINFLHIKASNAYYSKDVDGGPVKWPMADESHNLVTALSVWTHLREEDWRFYLKEVSRILSPNGRAIISFFVMDEFYNPEKKTSEISQFYPQPENKWIFDTPAYESTNWKYPSWAEIPETAIAIPKAIFDEEVASAGLKVIQYLPGQWKDQPGFFFQDVVIFERL